jgi:hypothetical protein
MYFGIQTAGAAGRQMRLPAAAGVVTEIGARSSAGASLFLRSSIQHLQLTSALPAASTEARRRFLQVGAMKMP